MDPRGISGRGAKKPQEGSEWGHIGFVYGSRGSIRVCVGGGETGF